MGRKLDTRAIGLDAGLKFIHWLTGAENMHYGLWDGLEVCAGNLRAAQEAYTTKLFSYLPGGKLRILDIGGGAGETAKKLIALGHEVDIVVPSDLLAERCRANAPKARVFQCKFEDFTPDAKYDLCLFSESFQYVPLAKGLSGALACLKDDGEILIADCFRSPAFKGTGKAGVTGGGHPIAAFRKELDNQPVKAAAEEDITSSVAPSIDLEQSLFNVIGYAITRTDAELSQKRRRTRWVLARALSLFMNERKRLRLDQRLNEQKRNRAVFCEFNQYLILRLIRQG